MRGGGAAYNRSFVGRLRSFTLAEVLITLGIIGVIAAITLPALIGNYAKVVVETRLKKFYSVINQAVVRAEADYGDKKDWAADLKGAQFDKDGNVIEGSSEQEKWIKMYLLPYMSGARTEIIKSSDAKSNGALLIRFQDGSGFMSRSHTTRDWIYFTNVDKCVKMYGYAINPSDGGLGMGECKFFFAFVPNIDGIDASGGGLQYWKYHVGKGFEPFKHAWDGNLIALENACMKKSKIYLYAGDLYCGAYLQSRGWTIPKGYPYKLIF